MYGLPPWLYQSGAHDPSLGWLRTQGLVVTPWMNHHAYPFIQWFFRCGYFLVGVNTRHTHPNPFFPFLCVHLHVSFPELFFSDFSTVFLPGSYQLVKPLITIHKCVFNLIAEPFLSPHKWELSLARSVSLGLELHPQSAVTLTRPRHLATLLTTTAAICLAVCLCYAHSIRTSPRISALCLLFFSGFNNYGGRQYLFLFFF